MHDLWELNNSTGFVIVYENNETMHLNKHAELLME